MMARGRVNVEGSGQDGSTIGEAMTALQFTFRPLDIPDLLILHDWLNRPHIAAWWGGPVSLERVRDDYTADIRGPSIWPMLACLAGEPVGYVQAYDVMQAGPGWWVDETDPGARGIDQFLADPSQLGRGLGSRMIAEVVSLLFGDPAITKVQADPSPDNGRAIRAYEKAGFRRVGEVTTPDGPALLMIIRRNQRR
jgi:RimJ/RimL family protein N-acetyltransferase